MVTPPRPYGRPDLREERAPGPFAPSVVRAGGLSIHHVDCGPPEAEALLLLPGLAATHRYFSRNFFALSARYRVLAPDLPGCGRSEKPDAPYTPAWFVSQLVAFLDVKGIARAHVAGNSLGGQIAMALALAHPERVGRLVLVAPAGLVPYPALVTRLLDVAERAAVPGVGLPRLPRIPSAALQLAFRAVFPKRPELAERYARGYAAGVASPEYPLYVRAALRAIRGSLAMPMQRAAGDIASETLIVWGGRDRVLPVASAEVLARSMLGSKLLIYPDAGHCPMLDEAERWNRDVLGFLDGAPG